MVNAQTLCVCRCEVPHSMLVVRFASNFFSDFHWPLLWCSVFVFVGVAELLLSKVPRCADAGDQMYRMPQGTGDEGGLIRKEALHSLSVSIAGCWLVGGNVRWKNFFPRTYHFAAFHSPVPHLCPCTWSIPQRCCFVEPSERKKKKWRRNCVNPNQKKSERAPFSPPDFFFFCFIPVVVADQYKLAPRLVLVFFFVFNLASAPYYQISFFVNCLSSKTLRRDATL